MCNANFKSELFICIVVTILFITGQLACFAATVSLTWDANSETDLGGYRVYYKTDSSALPFDGVGAAEGVSPVDVNNLTSATLSGLDPGRTYYFAVTAYNTSGLESPYSNIVEFPETVPPSASLSFPSTGPTLTDALLALQIGSGKVVPTGEQLSRLDVAPVLNGISVPNGVVDTGDAIVLLSKIVGKSIL